MAKKNSNLTQPTTASVDEFLASIADEKQRADSQRLRELMESISGQQAVLWGTSIIGFGSYHYRYESGREGDAPAVGFAPRSTNITVYITGGFADQQAVLARLGKHSTGKGCLYIKRLSDVDETALSAILQSSVAKAVQFDTASA